MFRCLVILAASLVLTLACSSDDDSGDAPAATSPPASPSPAARLTLDALKNAEYRAANNQTVRLTNGSYSEPSPVSAAPALMVRLVEANVAFGDLNGDGVEDAAVFLTTQTGGTGVFLSLVAVRNQNGAPVAAATTDLGDRQIIHSVAIASGVITADLTVHGPNDPGCCPTLRKMVRYRLMGANLVEV